MVGSVWKMWTKSQRRSSCDCLLLDWGANINPNVWHKSVDSWFHRTGGALFYLNSLIFKPCVHSFPKVLLQPHTQRLMFKWMEALAKKKCLHFLSTQTSSPVRLRRRALLQLLSRLCQRSASRPHWESVLWAQLLSPKTSSTSRPCRSLLGPTCPTPQTLRGSGNGSDTSNGHGSVCDSSETTAVCWRPPVYLQAIPDEEPVSDVALPSSGPAPPLWLHRVLPEAVYWNTVFHLLLPGGKTFKITTVSLTLFAISPNNDMRFDWCLLLCSLEQKFISVENIVLQ